jgi:hypothetical protein
MSGISDQMHPEGHGVPAGANALSGNPNSVHRHSGDGLSANIHAMPSNSNPLPEGRHAVPADADGLLNGGDDLPGNSDAVPADADDLHCSDNLLPSDCD